MKTETKTAVIIVVTLIIGMAIGSLLPGAFIRHRTGRFMAMREPEHLMGRIEDIIDPDESQREAVQEILHRHAERFHEIHSQFEAAMFALRDSLRKDLDSILTEEQKARLERGPTPPKHPRERRPGPWRPHEPGSPPPSDERQPPAPPTLDEGEQHLPPPPRDEG